MFYKAGLELKGEDKYSAYVKHIRNLPENIQLVNPLAIMHAVDESGGAKPLGSKSEMSTSMTVFLAYTPVGCNVKAFQPKKNNDRRKGRKGKDEPDTFNPSVYPTMVFCRTLNQKSSSPAWHMNLAAQGEFIFGRSNSSAKKQ